jgi:predicted permease
VAQVVVVLAAFGIGLLAARIGRLRPEAADVLNLLVIDVCVPATILRLIPRLQLEASLAVLVVIPWLLALAALGVAFLAARLLRLDPGLRTAMFVCVGLGNTSFLGYPLITALRGPAALPLAVVYDQLGSFLLLAVVGPVITATAAGREVTGNRWWAILRGVITFPPFVALVIAVAIAGWDQPAWLDQALGVFAGALVPLAMIAVGLRLRLVPPRPLAAFGVGMAAKLVLMPVLALGLLALLAASGFQAARLTRDVAVLQSAMPSMISAGAVVMAAGLAPETVAAWVGWGLIAGLLTVPAWAWLLS